MNIKRRKRLGQSLTQSLIEKLNGRDHRNLIKDEVTEFLKRETLSANDLKELEKVIKRKIKIV